MKYYFIGIKGSGMSTLANILFDLGNHIIGYDDALGYKFTMEGLNKRGIQIYDKENLPTLDKDTYVVYTAAINESHHEVRRVQDLGLKIIPYHELIGSLTLDKESICVCGTHGKTTTSLMIADILDKSIGCSFFVGDGSGKGDIDSDIFVLESCEYNRHFLAYSPDNTVITNIELDHTETYPTIDDMIDAYQKFVNKTTGFIVACGDDLNVRKLSILNKVYYYGFGNNNDLVIKNKNTINGKNSFDVYYHNEYFDHYSLDLFGDHMIKDTLAAIMIAILYSVDKQIIKEVLENFKLPLRRFSERIIGSNIIVDDYAHHPTEIMVTYDSARQKYGSKKIIAVFLPNTYSRTRDLFDDFCMALSLYDKAYIMDIYCDRENANDYPDISSDKLIEKIPNSEKISIDSINKLLSHKNSVICFMSCTNISKMINKYVEIVNANK